MRDKLAQVCVSKLSQIKLTDKVLVDVSGPQLVVGPHPQTKRPHQTMGWQLTVWLEHNKLVGQDPIGVTVGLMSLLPPQAAFERATEMLLEECRRIRDGANSPKLPEFTDEQRAELMRHREAEPKPAPEVPAEIPEPVAPEPERKPRERESHFS
ncbi:MAG: hypothetical protein ACRD6W_15325 [Nitrososphaerales archaeon]